MKSGTPRGDARRRLWLGAGSVLVYGTLGFLFYRRGLFYYFNALFNGDCPRVVLDLTTVHAPHVRTTVHPIVPLLALPFGVPLTRLLHAPELAALTLVVLAGSGAVVFAYSLFRTLTTKSEAFALALVYATSSSSLAMFTQPETFALSALGITATAYAVRRNAPLVLRAAAGVVLFGTLATNVIHLAAAEFLSVSQDLRAKARRAGTLVGIVVAALAALSWLQVRIVPNTKPFFRRGVVGDETRFFASFDSLGQAVTRVIDVVAHFLTYAFVAPAPRFWKPLDEPIDRVTFLEAWRMKVAGYHPLSLLVALAYLALLGWAVTVHVRSGRRRTETWSVAFVVLSHFGVFVLYGDDFLLYSPVWLVELVLGIALALSYAREEGRFTPPASALVALAGAAFACNAAVFQQIHAHFAPAVPCYFPGQACADQEPQRWLRGPTAKGPEVHPPPAELTGRTELQAEIRRRPGDHWSTRAAHVLFAEAASDLDAKAYYEVGGNLSPALGTFGVSFGTLDAAGKLVSASTDEPEASCSERWLLVEGRPAIDSTCPDRRVRTVFEAPGQFRLTVTPSHPRQVLLLRSAGPGGGPLWHVQQLEPGVLRLNDSWTVRLTPATKGAIGLELDGLEPSGFEATEAFDARGYAFARLPLDHPTQVELTRDGAVPAAPWPSPPSVALALRIPDEGFARALDASWLHLRAGITHGEVRPGDPAHYALPWLRDGAYVLAALGRTGDTPLVERLAPAFARADFFGGFGSEADAPGYALWALDQAAGALDSAPFVASVWPAVERKVALIERMTKGSLRVAPEGPLLPSYQHAKDTDRVADEPRQGCIAGRMDRLMPLYFVNAISFQGLRSAARLAELRGDAAHATAWRELAASLAHDCAPFKLDPAERSAPRTAISAVWPTFFAADGDDALRAGLEERWQADFGASGPSTMPLWTYFLVAEAHQWLYLGRPERARATLGWLTAHDPTRGLLAFPEGRGEPSGLWRRYRGWLRDEPVVPHYWTAAELVLLELDMLAFEDERTTPPTIVVGAGLERAWVEAGGVSFSGLRTRSARVSLGTEGGKLRIRVESKTPLRVLASPHLSGIPSEIVQ